MARASKTARPGASGQRKQRSAVRVRSSKAAKPLRTNEQAPTSELVAAATDKPATGWEYTPPFEGPYNEFDMIEMIVLTVDEALYFHRTHRIIERLHPDLIKQNMPYLLRENLAHVQAAVHWCNVFSGRLARSDVNTAPIHFISSQLSEGDQGLDALESHWPVLKAELRAQLDRLAMRAASAGVEGWVGPLTLETIAGLLGCEARWRTVKPRVELLGGEIERSGNRQAFRVKYIGMVPDARDRFEKLK